MNRNNRPEYIQRRYRLVEHLGTGGMAAVYWAHDETLDRNVAGKLLPPSQALVINTLKMRPDRILLGEAQGAEVLYLIQAMNTGHDGSMFTLHANSPRDALSRLEIMATMAGMDIPVLIVREKWRRPSI